MFQDKVIMITGGANGIGKYIAEEFQKQGTHVCIIDCAEDDHSVGDLADKTDLEDFTRGVVKNMAGKCAGECPAGGKTGVW